MNQIAGQITLNDILSESVPLGYVDESRKGKVIPFQELANYIGRRVVIELAWQSGVCYRVVMIKNYYKDADHTYRLNKSTGEYEMEHTYDKVGYSDDKKKAHKENSWVGEIHCKNGRWKPYFEYPNCFYEYNAM